MFLDVCALEFASVARTLVMSEDHLFVEIGLGGAPSFPRAGRGGGATPTGTHPVTRRSAVRFGPGGPRTRGRPSSTSYGPSQEVSGAEYPPPRRTVGRARASGDYRPTASCRTRGRNSIGPGWTRSATHRPRLSYVPEGLREGAEVDGVAATTAVFWQMLQ